jgi:HD-GYP domain-containing protein (c-di-GMP phosphodiesterase class II)
MHHHERWDGKGYPHGLSGEDIPFASRIIMVCDSIDAMLSDRPYRNALTVEVVEAELRKYAGSQFDAQVVDAVLRSAILPKVRQLILDDVGGDIPQVRLAAVV